MPHELTVHLLGPLEVRLGGRAIPVAGAKPRAVLTLLGLYAGRVVSSETLIEVLWGEDAPRTAQKALQTHVSALRRSIGDGFVLTKGSGWLLVDATTDASRFQELATVGREAARAGEVDKAVAAFADALETWRGTPELPDTPRAASEVARWAELRETVAEDRMDALLASGATAELVGELETSVAKEPLRERRWSQLMLALYRAGRQADALAAYQRARAMLDDQLGVEPGPELRRLEAAVLGHDSTLATPEPPPVPVREERQRVHAETAGALPAHRTTFVGRQDELRQIDDALRRHGLSTIVGPGGVGKTRLAIAAAQAAARLFRAGVVFVDLVPVGSSFVPQAVAAALGIAERPSQPLDNAIREHLAKGKWLLVMDNCEHVVEAASEFVAGLTNTCPDVVVLATSRERLGAGGERVIAVPPLSLVSAETGEVTGSDAVTLFLDRARSVAPDFDPEPELVAEVCAQLDGVPLAIELAAARCASLGLDGLLAALDDRMRLLMGARGTTERHRSLRAVLDWSYELLDDEERAVFRRVGVFAGGFDLDAAVAVVCGEDTPTPQGTAALSQAAVADLVGRLSDKNLLTCRRRQTLGRWRLLEIVRVYARERLSASGEDTVVFARHLRWATSVAEWLEQRLIAGEDWRERFDAVVDDLRAALYTASSMRSETPRTQSDAHRLALALGHLTYARSFLAEARKHYVTAAALSSGRAAADALCAASDVAFAEMRHHLAYELLLEAADRSTGDESAGARSIALAAAVVIGSRLPGGFAEPPSATRLAELLEQARAAADDSPRVRAHLLAAEAWTAEPARARCDGPLGEQALAAAEATGDPVLISAALDGLTTVALGRGRFRDAAALARGRLDLLDRLTDHEPRSGGEIIDIFHMASETALATGDLPAALANARRARKSPLGRGVPLLASSRLVLPLALSGAFPDALGEANDMWDAWERAGKPPATWMAPAVYAAAMAFGLTGDDYGFRFWSQRALELAADERVQGFAPFVECRVALHDGRIADAVAVVQRVPDEYMGKFDAYTRAIAAECAVVAVLPGAADLLTAAAPFGEQNDWAAACLQRASARLHNSSEGYAAAIDGWTAIEARFERDCTERLLERCVPVHTS